METTQWIWMNGEFIPWDKAHTHILAHTLHYGAGVFEGIRCYETQRGTGIFRLYDHIKRLLYSASAIQMSVPFSSKELCQAIIETVRRNKLEQGYIRPLIYYGYGKMGLNPVGSPVETTIACWPWEKYLAEEALRVKISPYCRIHPQSTVADAKICGHYVNSILASIDAKKTGYHEAILLDYEGYVAEGPGENIFIVKKNILKTPPLGRILKGITRDTILVLAKDLGYEVSEENLLPKDLYQADEAFFTGTAAEISPIASIDDHQIGAGNPGPITTNLKKMFIELIHGHLKCHKSFLTPVI